jgi:hypothetical protein
MVMLQVNGLSGAASIGCPHADVTVGLHCACDPADPLRRIAVNPAGMLAR